MQIIFDIYIIHFILHYNKSENKIYENSKNTSGYI